MNFGHFAILLVEEQATFFMSHVSVIRLLTRDFILLHFTYTYILSRIKMHNHFLDAETMKQMMSSLWYKVFCKLLRCFYIQQSFLRTFDRRRARSCLNLERTWIGGDISYTRIVHDLP